MPDPRRLQSELNVANLEIQRLRKENQQLKETGVGFGQITGVRDNTMQNRSYIEWYRLTMEDVASSL